MQFILNTVDPIFRSDINESEGDMTQTVLVLGQSGRFGRHATQAFSQAGWTVRGFDRKRDNLMQAAHGVDVIVNAWNPPYPQWADQVPKLHAQVRRAAKAVDATVIIPGNVYVFGPDVPHPWSEASPHRASNALGRIRIQMEEAYAAEGVKTIILRAGDFLDTTASGNWFDAIMIKSLAKGRFVYPGDPEIPHAWAFLPDLARAAVALAQRRASLPDFADIPFAGFTMSGREMAERIDALTSQPVALSSMNWLPLQLAKPFWPMGRCLLEMRYLWNTPHSLDGRLFADLVPEFQVTPIDQALAAALGQPTLVGQTDVHPNQSMPAGA